jgi:formylmethanofuran dehydrogenase subunit E
MAAVIRNMRFLNTGNVLNINRIKTPFTTIFATATTMEEVACSKCGAIVHQEKKNPDYVCANCLKRNSDG